MMDFRETGLPMDQTVYKAFMMFSKNAKDSFKDIPPEIAADMQDMPPPENFPVRVAQVLNQAGANDPQVLSLALLNVMPPQTYSIVEKSFGADMIRLMEEAGKHNLTGFAYIAEASDAVKLLTLASAIATFEEFGRVSQKAGEQLEKLAGGEQPKNGQFMIPMMPDTRIYDRLSEILTDKTSSPALESLFTQKLGDFRFANEQLKEKIIGLGIADQLPPQLGLGEPGGFNAFRYPSFGETTLFDDPKVRAAYDVLTSHTRVAPDAFEAALAVGQILSNDVASKNPTAIAAGLLGVGIRNLNDADFEFLDKKIDWDVIELLRNNSPEKVQHPMQLMRAPQEFKQIILANAVSALGHMKEGLSQMKEMLEMREEIPQEARPMILAENLQRLLFMTDMMEESVRFLGDTGAPELQQKFSDRLKEVRADIGQNMPDIPRALPPGFGGFRPPKPPKNPGGGQSFDFE